MLKVSNVTADGTEVPVGYFVDQEVMASVIDVMSSQYPILKIERDVKEVHLRDEDEVVLVYFESGSHAEAVAYIVSDSVYVDCVPGFLRLAKKGRMTVTESVDPEDREEPLWATVKEKMDAEALNGKKFWLKKLKGEEDEKSC